jgi:CheY-like chemotaxis protein
MKTMSDFSADSGTGFQEFQNLMRFRIRNILLVSSLYDLYLFEEDGRLYELIRDEYLGLNLTHSPEITRVPGGREALALIQEEQRYDLIITTLHIEDMSAMQFADMVRGVDDGVPVVLLMYDNFALKDLIARDETKSFDKVFVWQGDFRIILAIVKYFEDRMNVDHDTQAAGVQSIILVEDSYNYYSSFLPMLYTELLQQSKRVISKGLNISHKYLRMRSRPKILLCSTYEEAMEYFERYHEYILGVISDIDYYRGGVPDERAGIVLAETVKARQPDIPILLQSNQPEWEETANAIGVSFLLKNSPTFLYQLRLFMMDYFSFGDFIFYLPDGTEVGRAGDLESLERELKKIPAESIRYHAERNHFSNWLKARSEFPLAYKLHPRKVPDFPSLEALRNDLIRALIEYRESRTRSVITEFSKEMYDPANSFSRIGRGSLGGKARGLGFVNMLINTYNYRDRFRGVKISVPPSIVLSTDIFDYFIEMNELRSFVYEERTDEEIKHTFIASHKFPEYVVRQLTEYLNLVKVPLAIRSSSLLEDSLYHPFAGVYATIMIPNDHPDPLVRLNDLLIAIKHVYASTFFRQARDYIRMTRYQLAEEKMAVIIQQMIGLDHGARFYPDFSGVAKSHNFYPIHPQTPSDGTVSLALGLGKTIVEGSSCVRVCPKYPMHRLDGSSAKEMLNANQRRFYALDMASAPERLIGAPDALLQLYDLEVAEEDGTLGPIGSTYSPDNDAVYDGIGRDGIRLVTFGPMLKNKYFPLADIVARLLELGSWGMGSPVEIEFAANYLLPPDRPKEFFILQLRPMVVSREVEDLEVEDYDDEQLICRSRQVLGNGILSNIRDVVFVDIQKFERSQSQTVAREVAQFNATLVSERRPYLLIGVGRWGTMDPWLGIPVIWSHISGAQVIVETNPKDMTIEPSQGSHFFQNITAFHVGYFSVDSSSETSRIDWEWLLAQDAAAEKEYTRHLRFEAPMVVKIDGRNHQGLILKPGAVPA